MKYFPNNKILFPIILLALLSFAVTVNGQIERKTLLIGGELNSPLRFKGAEPFEIDIQTDVGYFFLNNFVIGAELDVEWVKPDETTTRTDLSIGPLARYYFGDNVFQPFAQIVYKGVFILHSQASRDDIGMAFQPALGCSYLLIPSVGIEALLKYNYYRHDDGVNGLQEESFASFHLGFQIYL